jgi:hypothetical protein
MMDSHFAEVRSVAPGSPMLVSVRAQLAAKRLFFVA